MSIEHLYFVIKAIVSIVCIELLGGFSSRALHTPNKGNLNLLNRLSAYV